MDPLHPIAPVQPNIPPITPTPLIGGIDRESERRGTDAEKRRRRQRANPPANEPGNTSGEGESGLHIDVKA